MVPTCLRSVETETSLVHRPLQHLFLKHSYETFDFCSFDLLTYPLTPFNNRQVPVAIAAERHISYPDKLCEKA